MEILDRQLARAGELRYFLEKRAGIGILRHTPLQIGDPRRHFMKFFDGDPVMLARHRAVAHRCQQVVDLSRRLGNFVQSRRMQERIADGRADHGRKHARVMQQPAESSCFFVNYLHVITYTIKTIEPQRSQRTPRDLKTNYKLND